MKNIMLFIHPSKNFLEEQKTAIKIEIDNNLSLGWKASDIILATNFPYEYNGVRSLIVRDDNYCIDISPCASIINVIVELFERKLIQKGELYWYHDTDLYQMYEITESELDLGKADIGLVVMGTRQKFSASSMFFKEGAEDIYRLAKEIMYKYRVNEELAINTACTNNLLWATASQGDARERFKPLNLPGSENIPERVKKLNVTYDIEWDSLGRNYPLATKPLKVCHFHFRSDLSLDSALYGKNSLKKVLMPQRLIEIFEKHGVKGTFPKKMKNLMVYISPEKKFLDKEEHLVKAQIDNSLELGWKKEDIILITNFPYEYQGIKSTVLDNSLFQNINTKANKTHVISYLLAQEVVKEKELWWYHDLDVFQLQLMDSSQIDLEDMTAGFTKNDANKLSLAGEFDLGSIFFRKDSDKIFEWTRNRACKLNTDEATALMSLTAENYRDINYRYTKLNLKPSLIARLLPDQLDTLDAQFIPKKLALLKEMNKIMNLYLNLMKISLTDLNHLEGNANPEIRIDGKDWPANADTMIGVKRLDNIEYCISEILKNNIEGDFIETGVWRGGAVIFMQAVLKAFDIKSRNVWVADSFEGLPKPNEVLYPADKGDTDYTIKELAISLETVRNNFKKYNLLDNNVKFLKGWFKNTLPTAEIKKLALLRLDGDMYESTMDALTNLYPKLSIGGYIIIDDWGAIPVCKKAVEDYRRQYNITEEMIIIDWTGIYWKKERDIK